MSSFTDATFEPVIDAVTGKQKKREGRKVYAIRGADGRGMRFHIGYLGSPQVVHVPEGFETDGPSIPTLESKGLLKLVGLVTWLIPQSVIERAMKSAAVHDYLCEHPLYERSAADGEFWVAMCAEGTPPFWRKRFFDSVITNNSKVMHNDPSLFESVKLGLFGHRGGSSERVPDARSD